MSDQLRELLRDLAQDAPAIDTTAGSAGDVWRRARRSRRRDLIAAVSLSVVLLVVGGLVIGLIGPGLQSTPPTAPAYGDGRLAIPNQIWVPSPWTPGTADAGPIGQLALIATAPRHTSWFHTEQDALFGVSAKTGQYRFLDLPRLAADSGVDPVLSPDGRYIAYFMSGQPSGTFVQSHVTGLAVYDTASGAATFHPVPTVHGLDADSVTWDRRSTRVVAAFSQYVTRPGTSYQKPPLVVNALTGATWRLPLATNNLLEGGNAGPVPGGVGVVSPNATGLAVLNLISGQIARFSFELKQAPGIGPVGPPVINPHTNFVVFAGDPDSGVGPRPYTATVFPSLFPSDFAAGPGPPSVSRIATGRDFIFAVDGITRRGSLLVEQYPPGARLPGVPQVYAVQIGGGQVHRAIALHGSVANWVTPSFASDILRSRVVPARPPAAPRDPRLVPGIVIGALIALGLLWAVIVAFRRLGRVPPPISSSPGSSR